MRIAEPSKLFCNIKSPRDESRASLNPHFAFRNPKRSAHEAYGARDAVVAEQHVGLDSTARALEVHGQTERHHRRARQLNPHKMPAVCLTEATALHERDEVRRNLSVARRLRGDLASGPRD